MVETWAAMDGFRAWNALFDRSIPKWTSKLTAALKNSQKETSTETKLVQDLYERIPTGFGHRSFQDLFSNEEMNAMHIEDIFSQILLRKKKFQQILYEMYVTYENSRINGRKVLRGL